jgi:hypothetical protein
VATDKGRVVVLTDLLEFGSAPGLRAIDMLELARQRYGFALFPDISKRTNREEPLKFEHGLVPEGGLDVHLFEIHPQGIVAECDTTEHAEAFLDDVFGWAQKELKLKRADQTGIRVYSSSLVVQFENDANGLLAKHKEVVGLISSALRKTYKFSLSAGMARIGIRPDPEELSPRMAGLIVEFSLERRVFAPYSEQKFYSTAPLPTKDHIELLNRLEQAVLV